MLRRNKADFALKNKKKSSDVRKLKSIDNSDLMNGRWQGIWWSISETSEPCEIRELYKTSEPCEVNIPGIVEQVKIVK